MNDDADKAGAGAASVKTVEEFVQRVQTLPGWRPLYRGLANAGWDVESAAYRRIKKYGGSPPSHEEFKNDIGQLLDNARMRDHHRHEGRELSDLELLARLQHFGAATCLVDFTQNPLVALWFACREKPKKDGKVVVMDTDVSGALKFLTADLRVTGSIKPQRQFALIRPDELRTDMQDFLDFEVLRTWAPIPRENRVIVQQSIFVFGKTVIEDRYYDEIHVPSSEKAGILSVLRGKFGVDEESLFGDFAGFALTNAHDKPYTECSADDYYGFAKLSSQSNDKKKAIQYCDKAIAENPRHVEAHFLRGECNFDLKNWQEAITGFSQAIKFDVKHVFSFFLRGVAYEVGLLKPAKAIDDYTSVIEIASNSTRKAVNELLAYAYSRRGCVKASMDEHLSALEDFTFAIKLDPRKPQVYLDRAKTYRELGKESEAQADEKKGG